MANYLFTNVLGVFVLDHNFTISSHTPFKVPPLDFSAWLPEEKDLLKKHKEIVYVGEKKEVIAGVATTLDQKLIRQILEQLSRNIHEYYSPALARTKVALKNSVHTDTLIVQARSAIDELQKVQNLLAKRLREWYELYNPETSRTIANHAAFARLIADRTRDALHQEMGIQNTMGADLPPNDVEAMQSLAKNVVVLETEIEHLVEYITSAMKSSCPNLLHLCGPLIGGKLLCIAGDLRRLALFPASTIQVLGAEKAMFRHLKTKSRSPKYGILLFHPLVAKASVKLKGKVARTLAEKIAIAARVDLYHGKFIADQLQKKLEAKFQ